MLPRRGNDEGSFGRARASDRHRVWRDESKSIDGEFVVVSYSGIADAGQACSGPSDITTAGTCVTTVIVVVAVVVDIVSMTGRLIRW